MVNLQSTTKYIPPYKREENLESHLKIDAPLLNTRIKTAKNGNQLLKIFGIYSHLFNAIHTSLFVNKLGKMKFNNKDELDKVKPQLYQKVEKFLNNFGFREIANITWGLGKMHRPSYRLLEKIETRVQNQELWKTTNNLQEIAMYLNGLHSSNKYLNFDLGQEIGSYIVKNPEILYQESTSIGAICLFAQGLSNHNGLKEKACKIVVDAFQKKGGVFKASVKENIIILKAIAATQVMNDQELFDEAIGDSIRNIDIKNKDSLWYLISLLNICSSLRYDNPDLIGAVLNLLKPENLKSFHDFDLPNTAIALAELAPENSERLTLIFNEMKSRWEGPENYRCDMNCFAQIGWALACVGQDTEAIKYCLNIAQKDYLSLDLKSKTQLYQMTVLVDEEIFKNRLLYDTQTIDHRIKTSEAQSQIAAGLNEKGYECQVEKYDSGFYFDIYLKDKKIGGKPVIIEVDGPNHFTNSGKETGSTMLQRKIIDKLGYHLLRVNLIRNLPVEAHIEELCELLK